MAKQSEIRTLLEVLPAEFYNNQVGSKTAKEEDDSNAETINETLLQISALLTEEMDKEIKPLPEELPYGLCDEYRCSDRLEGYREAMQKAQSIVKQKCGGGDDCRVL